MLCPVRISRRATRAVLVSAATVTALSAAACGTSTSVTSVTSSEPSPSQPQASTVRFDHSAGTTEVPTDAQRIVTTTDQNALLPLLELGVVPVASAGLIGDDGAQSFRRVDGYDTSEVEFVGACGIL